MEEYVTLEKEKLFATVPKTTLATNAKRVRIIFNILIHSIKTIVTVSLWKWSHILLNDNFQSGVWNENIMKEMNKEKQHHIQHVKISRVARRFDSTAKINNWCTVLFISCQNITRQIGTFVLHWSRSTKC